MPSSNARGVYLYVIEFSDGVVKVGQTVRPAERFAEHERDAKKIGCTTRRRWLSFPYMSSRYEQLLIEFCKVSWPRVQGLEFFDADFDEVVEFATELDEIALEAHRAKCPGAPRPQSNAAA